MNKNFLSKYKILLTFDVEDWFQVENFKDYIAFTSWSNFQLRVERNTHKILNLLDTFSFEPKATFFVLGWVAQRLPGLVKEIHNRGHEVANHGNLHNLCTNQSFNEVTIDLKKGKAILEDLIGQEIYGYRAPSFAINNDILKIIKDTGHIYDSSFNSFSMHDRYGHIDIENKDRQGVALKITDEFFELPISNLNVGQKVFPLGGGGYFRLIPFLFFKHAMKRVLQKDETFIFYSHPWEFDPKQPRVRSAPIISKFRHYTNQKKNYGKLKMMIDNFQKIKFLTCRDYLQQQFDD